MHLHIPGRTGMRVLNKADVPWSYVLKETDEYIIYFDGYPVNPGHRLYVPKYDTGSFIKMCFNIAYEDAIELVKAGSIECFNIGMNHGTAAGQTIDWPHIHLIPRYTGDTVDPTGGVRLVIPAQGNYKGNTYINPNTY